MTIQICHHDTDEDILELANNITGSVMKDGCVSGLLALAVTLQIIAHFYATQVAATALEDEVDMNEDQISHIAFHHANEALIEAATIMHPIVTKQLEGLMGEDDAPGPKDTIN